MNAYERGRKTAERFDAHMDVKSLTEALTARDAEIKAFAAKATEEIKSIGSVSTETKTALEKLSEHGTDLAARLAEVEQRLASKSYGGVAPSQKSFAEIALENEDFARAIRSKSSSSRIDLNGVKAATITSSATVASAGNAGVALVPQYQPGILTPAQRVLTIRDLVLPGSTASTVIHYVKETGFTNSAAPVAENAQRAQSDLTFEDVTTNVKNIGHWFAVSRQALEDIPALQSYINTRGIYGLRLVEENQLLAGDGTGENLKGLLNSDIQIYTPTTAEFRMDSIRRAVLKARLAEYQPTFIILNPTDFAEIELQKDGNNRYLWVDPVIGGVRQLWRLAVIETTAMTDGEFLVGSTMGSQIFDREGAVVEYSSDHSDFFITRKSAILIEERLAFAVTRPESYVHGTFNPA